MFGFVSSTGFRVLDSLLLYTMAMQTVQVQRHHEHLSVTQEDEKQYHDVKMKNFRIMIVFQFCFLVFCSLLCSVIGLGFFIGVHFARNSFTGCAQNLVLLVFCTR